jgi:hypothetical protein
MSTCWTNRNGRPPAQRSAQLFTIEPQRLQSSLQFRHQTSVDPQTSQASGSDSRGAVIP